MEQEELLKVVETLLFITDQPLTAAKIAKVAEVPEPKAVQDALAELQKRYFETGRTIQIIESGGGYQMATKPEYGRWVRQLYQEKLIAKFSVAALETLAIIAYKQPITRLEIEAVRGVDAITSLETLLERGIIKVVGRKEAVGRPLLYGTTGEFLRLFGLSSIGDLPKLESFGVDPELVANAAKDVHEVQQPELFPAEEQLPGSEVPAEGETVVSSEAAPEGEAEPQTENAAEAEDAPAEKAEDDQPAEMAEAMPEAVSENTSAQENDGEAQPEDTAPSFDENAEPAPQTEAPAEAAEDAPARESGNEAQSDEAVVPSDENAEPAQQAETAADVRQAETAQDVPAPEEPADKEGGTDA